jgi:hypothetical protein
MHNSTESKDGYEKDDYYDNLEKFMMNALNLTLKYV